MSSELDPAKLKVVELRAELQARGLDVKGNKPVLVKRLKEALEVELEKELPDTSIADTSTEDLNTSQDETEKEVVKEPSPEKEPDPEPVKEETEPETEKSEMSPASEEPTKDDDESKVENEEAVQEAEQSQPEEEDEEKMDTEASGDIEQNGDANGDAADEDSSEPKNRKSRWGSTAEAKEPTEETELEEQAVEQSEDKPVAEHEPRGDKRKHSSPSPERPAQRRRSKTPTVPEDEPVIDSSKVQLSWYDSDLHLQIDKETFLSGKPLHDGAFGYIWSGARLSHGIKTGKVCYEVKIVEDLKFEDILKIPSRDRKDRNRDKKDKGNRYDRDRNKNRIEIETTKSDNEKKDNDENKETQETEDSQPPQDEEMKEEPKESEEKEVDNEETAEAPKDIKEEKSEEEQMETDAEKPSEEPKAEEEEEEKVDDKKDETKEVESKPEDENHNIPPYLIRVGWSTLNSSLQLGEDQYSYGLESTGKFFNNKEITEQEIKFGVGDVVCAYLDMNDESIEMTFVINGETQTTTTIQRSDITEESLTLFPHVITRNYSFEINAGYLEEPWFPATEDFSDYTFISNFEDKVEAPARPTKRQECEVIMMCGLPASGKTHWVKEYVDKTEDKKYTIIGNSYILERMTVDARPIEEKVSKGRWNVVLDKLTKCLNKLCEIAAMRRRNFILDQTNVFPSAQRRKMRSFWGFKRHAVIVVNEDEEQTRRLKQQESQTGKDLPESAVLEMKANMSLPRTGEWLEKVTYVSLAEPEAKAQVQKYNTQGREAGFGNIQHRRDYRDDRGYNNRWGGHGMGARRDYRGGNYRDNRQFQNNRYNDRGHRQGGSWRSGGGGGGGWGMRNDRRDNRGPRDWRNNRGGMISVVNDRHRGGNRDHRNHGGSSGSFNRNRNQSGGGSSGNRSQGSWGNQMSNWNNQGQGGNWNNQAQGQNNWSGQGWNQGQGSWNQNQWKYGGGYGQGGYSQYANWNYYGQYAQNWNTQGQSGQTTTSTGTTVSNTTTDSSQQYAQMTPQQQHAAWAQYAQQYAQSTATNTSNQAQK